MKHEDNPLYPFIQILSMIISVGVVLLNGILIKIFYQQNNFKNLNIIFYAVIAIFQSFNSLLILFNQLYSIISLSKISHLLCRLSGFIFHCNLYITLSATILLAISKYFNITRMIRNQTPIKSFIFSSIFVALSIFSFIESMIQLINNEFVLMPSNVYCHINRNSPKYNINSIITLIILLGKL
ncbi:hypothetical protein K502DRAFT_162162 [Neoconidiobolus thromboides FSU 785]|nr:hypothetical protein K502DRAFT_162162 [Neoconidiobolus thromboides FSU 785]